MIKIAHLYYDLLNLYGEDGNIKALQNALSKLNIDYSLDRLTITDDIKFDNYDFIYIGSGTEENLNIVFEHLKNYIKDIKKYIESEKIMLVTGNTLDIFGKYIKTLDEKKHYTLDIFNYHSSEKEERIVSEVMFKMDTLGPLIGFYNTPNAMREEVVKNYNKLFQVIKRIGYQDDTIKFAGVNKNNFYGTHILGPLLVRNPELLKFFIARIIEVCNIEIDTIFTDISLEQKAKEEFIKNYYENKKGKKLR